MNVQIEESWKQVLTPEFDKDYFIRLTEFCSPGVSDYDRISSGKIDIQCFQSLPLQQSKSSYHRSGPIPRSRTSTWPLFLRKRRYSFSSVAAKYFKEIHDDLGTPIPTTGNLTRWAEQGVLLLNATLTVRAHQAGSHQRQGWEEFTDAAIRALAENREHLVFILWGAYAQKKGAFIDRNKHLVLTSVHPSPLSAYHGFFGNKHFSRANEYLIQHGEEPIKW